MAVSIEQSGAPRRLAYPGGVAVALLTSFLTAWTTVVRDDGNGIGFFLVIMAAAVGSFAAWFRPAGMARAMFGVAVVQALLGVAIATAPPAAKLLDASPNPLWCSAAFTALWLVSALLFRAARDKP